MSDFRIRTEDLLPEDVLGLYVATSQDRTIVESLKSPNPTILEGSRGTGKSFLLRVAEAQLLEKFGADRVLPVYISFVRSSLVHTSDRMQFHHWMLARICSRILRTLYKLGLVSKIDSGLSILGGGAPLLSGTAFQIEKIAEAYEESYKRPGVDVDSSAVPDTQDFKDAIEDICGALGISRFCLLFDESAHIFRPEQQRAFFTLFRDLRSPHISCNAAVYPGVTAYGSTFDLAHDATLLEIHRDVLDGDYREFMREIVAKQADAELMAAIERNGENFHALAYSVSGNPRLLLKTVALAPRMNAGEVGKVLKDFYRTDIWREHSGLSERYAGHKALIDWGRLFIENHVIPDTRAKNAQWLKEGKAESTCYFWVHRDAPAAVKEAIRLLAYTGVVVKKDSGVIATRSEIGTRYAVNLGCLVAPEATPIPAMSSLARQLTIKRFTEYGANVPVYKSLLDSVGKFEEPDMSQVLVAQLAKPVSVLDLTGFQVQSLRSLGLESIGKALRVSESELQRAPYIGPKRSRQMMNAIVASALEYLSG
ncbi:ORC-CDC6 family AAA ATPase [Corallococcus carmarthensis]|uniref:ORC-CDC6 family AAA ATPase n=1 Tax=Corallococcus carmarthensis TaxID=2316728 RepID=UPI00148BBABD|nr:hypothetical protein [Corallococcus carmarthensis]NOK17056.1 hypothetical protein [Corallococcus carmarthensis]